MAVSDYLRDLRSVVGSRLLLIPSAVALIFDDRGRLLMLRSAERNIWMLPGGAIDPDEHPEAAVVRETREETGLDVEIIELHSVHGGPEMRVTFANGDEISYVMTCYTCRITGGDGRPDDDEVAELRYVTQAETMELPTPPWGSVVLPRAFEARSEVESLARPRLLHFVPDPERASQWWHEHLHPTGAVFTENGYWGITLDECEIGFHPADETKNPTGASTVTYWPVSRLDSVRARLIEAGCRPLRGPLDIAPGRSICQLVDPHGIAFGLEGARDATPGAAHPTT